MTAQSSASSQLTQLLQRKRDEYIEQNPDDDRWPCAFCGQLCKTLGGCKGHITKSHPNITRGVIANDIDLNALSDATSGSIPHTHNEFSGIIRRLSDLLATNEANHDELDVILVDYVAVRPRAPIKKILSFAEIECVSTNRPVL